MNTTIIAAVLSLVTGFFFGTQYDVNNARPTQESVNAVDNTEVMDVPLAADFISVRPAVTALPSESLSEDEKADLIFMREEEKLARDVYTHLYEKWGMQIFANIAQSEQTHTEAIRTLLDKYSLTDPVVSDAVGKFTNTELSSLYNDLTSRGEESLVSALRVGALIEDLDIDDLTQALLRTDNADITLVYENLQRGSRNHLRSFTEQLERQGETYDPKYIGEAEYSAIVSTDRETGMQNGGGRGGNVKGNSLGRSDRGWGGRN